MFKVNDKVKVIGQDITGVIVRVHEDTAEIVIRDDDAHMWDDDGEADGELTYRPRELEMHNLD
jgi:hypothetical protein